MWSNFLKSTKKDRNVIKEKKGNEKKEIPKNKYKSKELRETEKKTKQAKSDNKN